MSHGYQNRSQINSVDKKYERRARWAVSLNRFWLGAGYPVRVNGFSGTNQVARFFYTITLTKVALATPPTLG